MVASRTTFTVTSPAARLASIDLSYLVVLPHAVFFGYFVGAVEMLIGISLLLGLWVRPASAVGIVFLLNLTLAAWWDPGHGAPWWRYLGARLDTLPLLLLLIIFFAADAGRVWGFDGRRPA